jgi:diguanylate cyclase (GGDEF)-like protein
MIDIPTLLGYSATLFAVIGGIFVFFWFKESTSIRYLWFGLPFLLGFLGAVFLMNPSVLPGIWDLRVGSWFVLLAYGFTWQAVRAFYRRQVLVLACVLPTLFWMALSIMVFGPWNWPAMSAGMRALIVAVFNALAAYELRRDGRDDLPSRPILFWVFAVYGMFALIRAPLAWLLPAPLGAGATKAWAVVVYNLSVVTQALLVGAFIISMTRERLAMDHYRMTLLDPLTDAYNRRAFEQQTRGWTQSSHPARTQVAALLFDIDNFKQINDGFGHAVGDQVIILAAQTARSVLRNSDTVFRMGGEEFICLLPGTSAEEAVEMAERLRHSFEMAAKNVAGKPVNATISIGISTSGTSTALPEGLLREADEALYRAKDTGRNRVVLAEGDPHTRS